jgi:hypothetical protein
MGPALARMGNGLRGKYIYVGFKYILLNWGKSQLYCRIHVGEMVKFLLQPGRGVLLTGQNVMQGDSLLPGQM